MNNDNNQQPICWAIIPAAGTSQRMQAERSKQYLPLLSSTVIEYSITNFLQHPKISGIFVALHENDKNWKELLIAEHKKIEVVVGGTTRAQSVYAALSKVQEKSKPNDFVLVHDAARPCLRYSDLNHLIDSLIHDEVGGILASPIHDTVKQSQTNQSSLVVKKTLDRTQLWKAYTPQMFRIDKLNQAFNICFERNIKVTDEASAIEAIGLSVKLIEGSSDNIKITRSEDIKLAEFILQNRA